MLAPHQRISRGSDFTRTLRHGVRVRGRDVHAYILVTPTSWPDPRGVRLDVAEPRGPRVGLIVNKAVGNAVVRHAVARRLRAASSSALAGLDTPATIVLRALPSAADATGAALAQQVGHAVRRAALSTIAPAGGAGA